MNNSKKAVPIFCLIIGIIGFLIIFGTPLTEPSTFDFALIIVGISIIGAIISLTKKDYSKKISIITLVLGVITVMYFISVKDTLDEVKRKESILKDYKYNSSYSVPSSSSTNNMPSKTTTNSNSSISTKNYQQIYDEYSQKLIKAGPTSSMNEMAQILNEGIREMAQYMYSASGTDGQYSTYESWANKLTQVYMNNVR